MAIVLGTIYTSPLPGGFKLIWGNAAFDSSYAGVAHTGTGEQMNLANYLTNTYAVVVIPAASNGYVLEHNGGSAYTGGMKARHTIFNTTTVNGTAANKALYEVQGTCDLSKVEFRFYAIGSAF